MTEQGRGEERKKMCMYTVYKTHMIALILQFACMVWIEYPWIKERGSCPLEYRLQHAKQ